MSSSCSSVKAIKQCGKLESKFFDKSAFNTEVNYESSWGISVSCISLRRISLGLKLSKQLLFLSTGSIDGSNLTDNYALVKHYFDIFFIGFPSISKLIFLEWLSPYISSI